MDKEKFAAMIANKQDNPTMHELAKTFPEKTYRELEIYRDSDRHAEANQVPLTEAQKNLVEHIEAGTCIMGEMRKDRDEESELDRTKRANNDLYNRVAELIEIDGSHQRLNGKLQMRIAELEEENNKMRKHLDQQLEAARKAGL